MLLKFILSVVLCFSEILAKDFYSKDVLKDEKSEKCK